MVQAGGDEETLQKAVQEQAEVAGGGDQIGQCADDVLHRRPEEAGTKAEQDGKDHHAGKGPAVAGVDLGDDALELLSQVRLYTQPQTRPSRMPPNTPISTVWMPNTVD